MANYVNVNVNVKVTGSDGNKRIYQLRSLYQLTDLLSYLPVGTEVIVSTVAVLDWQDDAERILTESGYDYTPKCE